MSMRARRRSHKNLYPKWSSKQNSPSRRVKERDGNKCVQCGVEDRTLITDKAGQPLYVLYLHAAHVNLLDPQYQDIEPIEDQVLIALCPRCHRIYDLYWQERAAELEHQRAMHHILLSRWLPNEWLQKRFLEVV
ncbi:MAG TPA: hypothetical protein VFV38_19165 [Ktedonobacteraceae bacterium]|nr:hypothetical protein [Ktedonobacteraceae bacterium]